MLLEIIWCFQRNVTNRLEKKLVLQIVLNARAMRQRIYRYYNANIILSITTFMITNNFITFLNQSE